MKLPKATSILAFHCRLRGFFFFFATVPGRPEPLHLRGF